MVILHCLGILDRGGAESMLMNFYRHIDRDKFSFVFLVHSEKRGDYEEEIGELGGAVHRTKSLGDSGLIPYIASFKNILSQIPSIDSVHIHLDWQGGFIALAAWLGGCKNIIVHSHTCNSCNKDSLAKQAATTVSKLLIHFMARKRLACSTAAGENLFGKDRFTILNNAISFEEYALGENSLQRDAIRTTLRIKWNEALLCHVGSFSDNKNQNFLLELAKDLKEESYRFKMILIGSGNEVYQKLIADRIKKMKLEEHVLLLGVKDNVPAFLNASDIFLFPSKREGFGMVAVEAQAAGLPCLISDAVPREVDIGLHLTKFIGLDDRQEWLRAIRNPGERIYDEQKKFSALKKHDLEISEQVSILESIYESTKNRGTASR